MALTIAWLPAHPSDGSESMLRYWRALRGQRGEGQRDGLKIVEVIAPPGGPARRAGLVRRFWWKRIYYPWRVASLPRADVYHLLDHSFAHLLPWLPHGARIVATVHDLAPLEEDGRLTPAQRRRFRAAMEHLRLAVRIVAISQFTAASIVRELGIAEDRISVVPMGTSLGLARPLSDMGHAGFGLSVGSTEPRKNLSLLPSIFERAVQSVPGLRLVRVGAPLPSPLRQNLLRVLAGRLDERGYVDDETLAGLYANALALVMPSRLEGFGLPVVEAMACGCPVVCSRAASLPEVGGDAALYFDADDATAAAAHLVRLATQSGRRAAAVSAGLAQARKFTWAAHAARLTAIYREVAAG